MPSFFPTPQKDELLYSVIARYHYYSGNISFHSTARDLFGSHHACAIADLPSRLLSLAEKLRPWTALDADYLRDKHTMFPLYRLFLPLERAENVAGQMNSPRMGSKVHMCIGQMASRIPSLPVLRYCRQCVEDDANVHGDAYWHRSHQVYGIRLCYRHGTPLCDSSVRTGIQGRRNSYVRLSPRLFDAPPQLVHDREEQLWLAHAVHWLLNEAYEQVAPGLPAIRNRYLDLLGSFDLIKGKASVANKELMYRFMAFYPVHFLEEIGCVLKCSEADNWLLKLVRKPRCVSHPLHHLLLVRFLGIELESFFSGAIHELHPFGSAPWPCLNPAAGHYRKDVVENCLVHYRSAGKPIGTFTCSCGFSYTRIGPDRCQADRTCFSRVITFGDLWEESLKKSHSSGLSLREIARRHGVDAKTVIRHLSRLPPPDPETTTNFHYITTLESNRECWRACINSHPDFGVKGLRKMAPRIYVWLYRHDTEWLKINSPSKKITTKPHVHVDWGQRDRELSSRVAETVAAIRMESHPAVRVSVSAIGKGLGALSIIQKKLDKLPLTAKAIGDAVETRIAFTERRLISAMEAFKANHIIPEEWELFKAAGIREDMFEAVGALVKRLVVK